MSTYAYDQLVRAFRKARREIRAEVNKRDAVRVVLTSDDSLEQAGVDCVAEALVAILADDDPKFDAEAFRRAVGA